MDFVTEGREFGDDPLGCPEFLITDFRVSMQIAAKCDHLREHLQGLLPNKIGNHDSSGKTMRSPGFGMSTCVSELSAACA